jgi:HK97 family phage prohead protease
VDKRYTTGIVKDINVTERTLTAYASTGQRDRDNEIIEPEAWRQSIQERSSVPLAWTHDYRIPPIGKADRFEIDAHGLLFTAQFANSDFAGEIWELYRDGFLNSFSVGFRPLQWVDGNTQEGGVRRTFTEAELLEISAVMIPANPGAQVQRGVPVVAFKTLDDLLEHKRVISYRRTPLADKGRAWDGPAQVAAAEVSDLRIMCTWYDAENPDIKSSYKLPHHLASGDHACVWRGVTAAMGRLMQAATQIPDGDRRGCYNHLSRHYRDDFSEEPPEFRSYSEAEWKQLFEENEDETSTLPATIDDDPERDGAELTAEQEAALAQALADLGLLVAEEYL